MAAARLEAENPGLDLTLAEAEPPEALRMLRAGYVDVALVFRHYQDGATVSPTGDTDEGTRSRLLLEDPIHLVTRAAAGADARMPRAADEPPLPPWPDLADYADMLHYATDPLKNLSTLIPQLESLSENLDSSSVHQYKAVVEEMRDTADRITDSAHALSRAAPPPPATRPAVNQLHQSALQGHPHGSGRGAPSGGASPRAWHS